MMNCLKIGCRTRVVTDDGEFEGTIQSFDVQLGFIALKNVICLKSQKKFPNIINFMKNEIRKLTILSEPKPKKKRALAGNVQPQAATKTVESGKVKEEPSIQSRQSMSPESSGKLSKKIEEAIPRTSVLNRSTVEIHSTEQALLGGVPSQYCEAGNQCIGESPNVASDYVLLEEVSDEFYLAINKICSTTVIGVAMEGTNLGRNGQLCWIMISTKHHVFLFDILSFGEEVLTDVLKSVFENENILKVVHDCRIISDLLFHRFRIGFVNVFDTQVASVVLYRKSYGRFPKSVDSLVVCILKNLNLPDEVIYAQKALVHSFKSNPSVWNVRPATDNILQAAAFSVRYLCELRLRLIEKMLADFVNGVDIYLGVMRDASDSHLANLQNRSHMLPTEFQNIQFNADASRRRMEELYSREPGDHRVIGCLATVDKFIASAPQDRKQDAYKENIKLNSPEQMNPWKTSNDFDFKDERTKGASGVHPKDEGQNGVKGHDPADAESACELTLDDVIKIKAATAPKSDDFILVAAGSESTQCDKKQLQKTVKSAACRLSDFDSEDPANTAVSTTCAKSRSRRVPVFDDVSIIPSSSEPVIYIGRCTTDGFATSSDGSTTPGDDAKSGKTLAIVARDSAIGKPGLSRKHHRCYEDLFVFDKRSDGCTSSSGSDEGIQESYAVQGLVPKGRGAHIMKLLGLHDLPRPGMQMVRSSPK